MFAYFTNGINIRKKVKIPPHPTSKGAGHNFLEGRGKQHGLWNIVPFQSSPRAYLLIERGTMPCPSLNLWGLPSTEPG